MASLPPVGYLISQYPAVNHTFILREIRSLRAQGFDIRAVSIRPADRPASALSADEAEEHRLTFSVLAQGWPAIFLAQFRVFLGRPLAYLGALFYAWSLTRGRLPLLLPYTAYFFEAAAAGEYFQRQQVALIHTHFASTVLLLLTRLFPIPYSLSMHGPDEFNDVAGFHMADKVAGARFVASISRFASSQLMRASDTAHWDKVHTLPLGVDPEAYQPRPAPPSAPGQPFRLVCVGRLAPAKAQHMLIAAIAELRAAGRSVELTLVGDGPSRSSLEALIARLQLGSAVRLAGACNHDRVLDFYRQSHAFVLASFAEGVPVVLMEAMAMEIPCVSTWITGIPELIQSEVEGLLVPPADPTALAQAVIRLMDDPELALRLGQAGRRKVLARYHLAINTQRLGAVFSSELKSLQPK